MVNSEDSDTLAEVGVVLYLEDLKEVSQQTNKVKSALTRCSILDTRIRVKRRRFAHQRDYLRCEVEEPRTTTRRTNNAGGVAAGSGRDSAGTPLICKIEQEDGAAWTPPAA